MHLLKHKQKEYNQPGHCPKCNSPMQLKGDLPGHQYWLCENCKYKLFITNK